MTCSLLEWEEPERVVLGVPRGWPGLSLLYKDLAGFLPDLHLLSSAASLSLFQPHGHPHCPWDP